MKLALGFLSVLLLMADDARAERARSAADATVFIRLVGSLHAEIEENGLKRALDVDRVEIATGSGFVISPFGYVITNNHVVSSTEPFLVTRGAQHMKITARVARIDVCFPQGTLQAQGLASACAEATIAAADPALDLAALFVNTSNLPYVAMGDSDAVAAGVQVDALGYPFGRDVEVGKFATARDIVPEISTTPGAVSALRAGDGGERRFLQITNTLNPGNSGGPLVDRDGFALGVIAMKLARATGIGFAIPINVVKDFLESHGVDQLMPARRLRLGPLQTLETKGLSVRMPEGMTDVSAFRSRVETEARAGEVVLRIDRVFSPWTPAQMEQTLVGTQTFEPLAMSAESRRSSRSADSAVLVGRATGTRANGREEVQIEYGLLDLGSEKLVARFVGPVEQIAFNERVLQDSLASVEGQRLIAAGPPGADGVDSVQWTMAPAANGEGSVPLPAGWVVEPGGPSPCGGLPRAGSAASTFSARDFTVALRIAIWSGREVAADQAAAACSSSRGPFGPASYALHAEWLGVPYVIEGVFARVGSGLAVQLEVAAPDEKRASARALLTAWLKKATE